MLSFFKGLIAVLGNLITIIAVYKYEFLWEKSASRLVASLAFADLFGGLGPFCALTRHLVSATSTLNALCFLNIFLNVLAAFGNVYNILLVTIDR